MAIDMDALRAKVKQKDEKQKPEFIPIDLNEDSVQAIFKQCLGSKQSENLFGLVLLEKKNGYPQESKKIIFDQEKILSNRDNIAYLFGQLRDVHTANGYISPSSVTVKYDKNRWTQNKGIIFAFLHLGYAVGLFDAFINKGDGSKAELSPICPTLSPQDPQFAVWRETSADALMLWADIAMRKEDYTEALPLYEKAAEQGNANAQLNCGVMYFKGEGTAKDDAKAIYWCEKAVEQGEESAKELLPLLKKHYASAILDDALKAYETKDYKKALSLFEKAAEQGNASARFSLGLMYIKGEGTAKDDAKALYWIEKAAEQGYARAQLDCGRMYANGRGSTKDWAKAKAYFQKAADQTEDKDTQEEAKEGLRKYF